MRRLPDLHDGLRQAEDVGTLFARGAQIAARECGFGRGLVVSVRERAFTAETTDPLPDEDSDRLRRLLLEEPVSVRPGTVEAELLRRPRKSAPAGLPSALADRLELEHPAFAPVAPEDTTLALLVLDRPAAGEVDEAARSMTALMGRMISVVLEYTALRARIGELSAELRFLTVSVQALAQEAFEGPITLPVHGRHLPTFQGFEAVWSRGAGDQVRALLTERETEIGTLLARGRSNVDIAEQLFISPETVKDHVSNLMRKLGATNRVELAVRFLGLAPEP